MYPFEVMKCAPIVPRNMWELHLNFILLTMFFSYYRIVRVTIARNLFVYFRNRKGEGASPLQLALYCNIFIFPIIKKSVNMQPQNHI